MPTALVVALAATGIFALAASLLYDVLKKERQRKRRTRLLRQWVKAQQQIRYREIPIRMPDHE
jgi:hypothetical protein